MNAIVPRKTVEEVVAARNETLRRYEEAFGKVAEASQALSDARAMWKEAAPSVEGRYYDAGKETKAFFKVVQMPDREQYLATARRLVDITVWQHVVEISGIEDLMDREEKDKLRSQMQYRAPKFRSANNFLETLLKFVEWAEEDSEHGDIFGTLRSFQRELKDLADGPETFEALGETGIETVRGYARRMVDAVKAADLNGSVWLQDLTTAVDAFESLIINPKGLPPVTVDNIMATLNGLLGQSNEIFMRGVANSFSALDRRFRSHDGFKIGSRIIIDRLCDADGWLSYGRREDVFVDVERIFKVLDGGKPGAMYGSIIEVIRRERGNSLNARYSEHEGDYFKVRIFKNGNAHLWFTRKDLVLKVNRILAEYYGEVVGDGMTKEEDPLKNVKTTPAKRYGFYPTPDAAVKTMLDQVPLYRSKDDPPLKILEPSAGTGNLSRPLAAERTGSHRQSYGEPSIEYTYRHDVDVVEIQPHLADALEADGCYNRVFKSDFLALRPETTGLYDIIVMNPPFDRERDIDHVVHALKFLRPGATLVAIMSAGTEFRETKKAKAFRALAATMSADWRDLPPGSFAESGTYMNTLILKVRKPSGH
ncbi:MAG: DUF4942 domain-containing protein [Roseibium sp.]|nr:DUF4942 domain-containing protein [Roseibium sp.]